MSLLVLRKNKQLEFTLVLHISFTLRSKKFTFNDYFTTVRRLVGWEQDVESLN